MSMHLLRDQFLLRLPLALLCLALSACASLPDVQYLKTSLQPQDSATIQTAQGGTLSKEKTESLLARRLRSDNVALPELAALEEAATGSPLIAGNKLTLLNDGPDTLRAMIAAISTAKDHVNLETYIFNEDSIGTEFAELLMQKQREGVQVNIIYDSIGSLSTPPEFFQKLRDSGINLLEFSPVNPFKRALSTRLNNRDHRKILVVDGRIAFTGGINISSDYSSKSLFRSSKKKDDDLGWRDTHIQVEGPAVASFQWLFMQTWVSQKTDSLATRNYFPPLTRMGDKVVRVIGSEPGGNYEVYKAYVLAMQEAKVSIHVTNAYFVPDVQLVQALTDAAKRGVDVKMVFPGMSDVGLIMHAGRSFYTELLSAGVRIFELQASVLHAKTAVIDGYWSTVGSTNMDMRSFLHNREVNLIALDKAFGDVMESAFNEDLKNSIEIKPEEWAQRPFSNRMKEWLARRLEYWL
jgi:cardiolipin synthase